jgi:hypothetical protein
MNALELTLIRIGFLAVLWLFVIAAVGVIRTDLIGHSSAGSRRPPRRGRTPGRPQRPRGPRRRARTAAHRSSCW